MLAHDCRLFGIERWQLSFRDQLKNRQGIARPCLHYRTGALDPRFNQTISKRRRDEYFPRKRRKDLVPRES